MVAYHYDFRIALVKGSPNTVAANATVLVYDPLDTSYTTPLTVYSDPALTTIVNLVTDAYGVPPDFWTNNLPDLLWKSGTMTGGWATTSSRPGLRGEKGDTGATGPMGPQGNPGLNGAGTNAEVAVFVSGPGETQDAVDTTVGNKIGTPGTGIRDALDATFATKPTNGARAVGKGELFLNVKDYGAVGDGVADDTAAVQAWLTAGGSYLRDVTLRITTGLTLAGNNRALFMDNAKILADGVNITALTVTGDNARVRARIDGLNKANIGITVTGAAAIIENSLIENIYSTTLTARGIDVQTSGGCTIRNNTVRNINSVGNASTGDSNGASRAIMLTSTVAATARTVITNNVIDNVIGEEGDGIQVITTGYVSAKATISGNVISNVSRRFIKIQAADGQILSNTCTHDGAVPNHPANAIDLISSSNWLVEGNFIGPNPLSVSISCSGVSGTPNLNNIIRNNTIRQDDAKNAISLYCTYVNESVIENNTFHGGSYAVNIGNCVGVNISGNTHFGGNTSNASFVANGTNTGVVMRNNVNMAPARVTTTSNASVSGLTEYNAKRP